MEDHSGISIKLSGIPLEEIVNFRTNPEFRDKFIIKIIPPMRGSLGMRARVTDGDYGVVIEIVRGLSVGVAGNYLTEWVKNLSQKYDIKKLLIEKDEVNTLSTSPQIINQIIIENININHRRDEGEDLLWTHFHY